MKRAMLVVVMFGLAAPPATAQEPGGAPPDPPPAASSPVGDALVNKFLTCYQEEAEVTPEDQATIKQFSSDMAEGLANVLSKTKVNIKGAAGPKADKVLNPQAIAGYSCKDLASKLEEAMSGGGLDKLLGESPAEPWAVAYTAAISDKVLQCYAVEVNRSATEEEKSKLTQFNGRMAQMVSLMTSTGTCTVEASKQPACFEGIKQLLCTDIATALGADAGQLIKALSAACAGYINCGIEAAIEKELK